MIDQGKELVITAGAALNEQLPFLARSVFVFNLSAQWLRVGGTSYVRPYQPGQLLPLSGVTTASATWEAPPGQTQPGAVAGQIATLRYYRTANPPWARA